MENPVRPERRNNFTVLKEEGPFKTNGIPTRKLNLSLAKKWIKDLSPDIRTRVLETREAIFQILGVESFPEIQEIIKNPEKRDEVSKKAYRLLSEDYQVGGDNKEIVAKISSYAHTADSVINYLIGKGKILSDSSTDLEMINEVSAANNPVDLLLMAFDERYSQKARFEAKRKLILMKLAGSIDKREIETRNEEKFNKFIGFLSEHVLNREAKIGETETVFVLSTHDPQTFECTGHKLISREEKEKIKLEKGQKLTELRWRKFQAENLQIPAYISARKKDKEAKILKLLRKGVENPAIAVEDDLGILGVFRTKKDIDRFQRRLIQGATTFGSTISFEEIADSLENGKYNSKNTGSNPELKQRNFFVNMAGMRVEVILHTIDTYLNYLYRRGFSHEEYDAKRIFESGVLELLFPKSVYSIDWEDRKSKIIQDVRDRVEK